MSKKLDDVLDAKNGAIKDLQYELARVTKARRLLQPNPNPNPNPNHQGAPRRSLQPAYMLPHSSLPYSRSHAATYLLPRTA